MILNRLRATNVLKYASLELNDIPEKGQIAISGPNESGKTAVVETICFALFGRTFSQGPDELPGLIRWGEASCELELVFTVNNNKVYTVRRTVDSAGVHSAELHELNVDKPLASGPHTVHDAMVDICGFDYPQYLDALYLAQMEISAPHSQSETIKEIAGTAELEDVATEIEQEIASEHSAIRRLESELSELEQQIELLDIRSDMSQRLDGERRAAEEQISGHEEKIRALEEVAAGVQGMASQLDALLARLTKVDTTLSIGAWKGLDVQFQTVAEKLNAACEAVDEGVPLCEDESQMAFLYELDQRLESLRPVEDKLRTYRGELAARLGEPSPVGEGLEGEIPLPRQIEGRRGRLTAVQVSRGVGQWVFFAVALAALAVWALWWLVQPPSSGHGAGLGAGWLLEHVSWWRPEVAEWLFPSAVGLSVLAVLSLIWPIRANSRAGQLRGEIARLEEVRQGLRRELDMLEGLEDRPFSEVDAYLSGLKALDIGKEWQSFVADDGAIFGDSESLDEYRQETEDVVRSNIGPQVGVVRETVAARIGGLRQAIADRHERLAEFHGQYEDWERRKAKAAELQDMIDHLTPRCEIHQENIRQRELAVRLVRDTCRNIYNRFNGVLNKYTSEVMPRLTDGRYSQMQIDDDLGIRVFSSAKNDFAQLKEFSSGTQRQMMLALRLAMAKALVEAAGQRNQFIILDEPFAFFDRERIGNTLSTLPSLDKHMSQIWIISQEFESYDPFKLHIQCSRENEELRVG